MSSTSDVYIGKKKRKVYFLCCRVLAGHFNYKHHILVKMLNFIFLIIQAVVFVVCIHLVACLVSDFEMFF